MNDALKEQVSALVDDEVRKEEQPLLLRQLAQNPELAAQVGRYSLIGEAMRRSLPPIVGSDLARRVAEELANEEAHSTPVSRFGRQALLKPLAGVAVAASVAAVSLAVWPTLQSPGGNEPPMAEMASSAPSGSSASATTGAAMSSGISPISPVASPMRSMAGFQQTTMSPTEEYGQWDRLEPQVQQRLNDYLVNHSEHTATGRFGGMLNYVRITGHSNDE
ncbi:hypothetical protein CAI21_12280 [Alkalilimnicola ehrlichii]|uniref:Anti sigma-E protein RseA N-terminal domain-containing protein n=1 Tax=Alkalilimnicola ehrlichii TaxID=351052 RepID=A0A3E0X2H3_9GAMM|nr:sigma-E factor negative regulatory protein [Alkalilimnicola ehrlichii]RFA28352.1 hypothetical protein CAI21_12280 [Alkalilimnicola ehrlichii]RFA38583.1 hypothetical protein CAL65_04380 [Alkalilimnicola ehrlichii]